MYLSNVDSTGRIIADNNQNNLQGHNGDYQSQHQQSMHQSFQQQPSVNLAYQAASLAPSLSGLVSLPPNVVSDVLAKDPHQLLLAHLYNYLKENGMHELAKLLLSEAGRVPNNTGMQSPLLPHDQQRIDSKMLISSSDTFLLEWWCLMWTMQLNMNPNLNQMFNRPGQQVNMMNAPQPPDQQIQPMLLPMQPGLQQNPINPDAVQIQNQQMQLQLQMQLQQQQQQQQQQPSQQQQIQQQQLQQLQQLQQVQNPTPLQKQQQQVLQQRIMLQQQHQMANQQFMNPSSQPALKENGNFVVPVSNTIANKMPPPQNTAVPGNPNANNPNAKNSMRQYQHQLRLQQMKLQYQQQQAQILQRQQQGPNAGGDKSQLQSPLLANPQQKRPVQHPGQPQPSGPPQQQSQQPQHPQHPQQPQQLQPQKPMDASNDYQMNMLNMENQHNFQKKQFLMKQQGSQQQNIVNGGPSNAVPLQNMGPQQPQHQQMMMQMAMNQKRRLSGNLLISPHMQEEKNHPANNDKVLGGMDNGTPRAEDTDELKIDMMPNMGMNDTGNMTAQQQHQMNLQMQLQQKRLKFIQQQQAQMNLYNNNNLAANMGGGMPTNAGVNDLSGDINYPGILGDAGMNLMLMNPAMMNKMDNLNSQRSSDSSNGNNLLDHLKDNSQGNGMGFIENDWLSQMGSGPGFA